MKKTNLTRSLLAACSIVALSAVMYGCTGSSGPSQDEYDAKSEALDQERETHAATQADLDTANSDLMTANGEVTSLTGELDTANGNVTRLEGELMTAQGEVTRLTGELMTSQDNASDLQMQLTAANDDVTRLTGELGTATDEVTRLKGELETVKGELETVKGERDKYKGMVADGEKKVEDDERIARAKAIALAIGGNRVTATRQRDDGAGTLVTNRDGTTMGSQMPFGTAADNGMTVRAHDVAPSRMADGAVKVTLTARGTPGTAAPAVDLKFKGGEATADADNPWTMTMLTRRLGEDMAAKTDDETEDVVVYTDIEAPVERPIADLYMTGMSYVAIGDADERGRVKLTRVPEAEGDPLVYGPLATGIGGTYRGIDGTFTCPTGCTVTTAADGTVTIVNGNGDMQFTPEDVIATYDKADDGYVYFGWWLNKPDKNTDDHMVEAFAGGNNIATAPAGLEGTATYMGPAAGKYVTKSFTDGDPTDAQVGHFNATATLTANFGPDKVGDLLADMISGSVTGFEQDGESLGTWKVSLKEATIDPSGSFASTTDMNFGGATSGDAGLWQGQFYGPGATPAADQPGTAAGTFDALVGDSGYVTGAFGAQKQ